MIERRKNWRYARVLDAQVAPLENDQAEVLLRMFEENIRAHSNRAGGIPSVIIQEEPLQHSPHSLSFEAPSVQFESENPEDYHGYTTLIGPQSDHEESCLYN